MKTDNAYKNDSDSYGDDDFEQSPIKKLGIDPPKLVNIKNANRSEVMLSSTGMNSSTGLNSRNINGPNKYLTGQRSHKNLSKLPGTISVYSGQSNLLNYNIF
jgi:hypothetical protein